MIRFRVHGTPQPKGSVSAFYDKRRHRMQRFDSNRKGKPWARLVRQAIVEATGWEEGGPAANGRAVPVQVHVRFYLLRPKSTKYRDEPVGKPDVDKLIRGVLDAIKGAAYVDDAQVVGVLATKQWTMYENDAGAQVVVSALD